MSKQASPPAPTKTYGAGYLFHYHADYQDYHARFMAAGGEADIFEILAVQFHSDPEAMPALVAELGKPVTLHSYDYCLGNVERPPRKSLERIERYVKSAGIAYVGEHLALMGTARDYCGTFFQPPGTEEQTRMLIDNVRHLKKTVGCPVIIENAVQFYRPIGPHTLGEQLRIVSEEADVGILLSLSNVSVSDLYRPQDREAFLREIPLSRVRQIHVLLNNEAEERTPGMERARNEQRWLLETLEELAGDDALRPSSVIFELAAMTSSLAEPERLRDALHTTRDLFFRARREERGDAQSGKRRAAKRGGKTAKKED
jgi:hypothetical protein